MLPPCPELDCIRHLLSPGLAAAAELRAAEVGVGADRVLIAADIISEEAYLAALTATEGFKFETLEDIPSDALLMDGRQLIEAGTVGHLKVRIDDQDILIVAPSRLAVRKIIEERRSGNRLVNHVRFTTNQQLRQFIARHAAEALADRAATALKRSRPLFSAGVRSWWPVVTIVSLIAAIVLNYFFAPRAVILGFDFIVALIVWTWAGLRLLSLREPHIPPKKLCHQSDRDLPIYTVIVALYREAATVKKLITALKCLHYPAEKLEVKIVLEADDRETRLRLETMQLDARFEIVIAPPNEPRTKPKALNAALPSARGKYVVVYDAEDQPDPDQLRRAIEAFESDPSLACVQARLTIDNTKDGWIAALFTAEYTGLFDVLLPWLAARRLPLPLGGSSNHFRAAILKSVDGWDPYNVTEDADLGMRLARFGHGIAVIDSSTHEEAPARVTPWLRQRTRWFKGWLATWFVHMRTPRLLFSALGPKGFLVFQLMVGGTLFAALAHPFFLAALVCEIANIDKADMTAVTAAALHAGILLVGYAASIALAFAGLRRRNLLNCAPTLLLMPLYWLLLSIAAWRAIYQFIRDPYRWEKTEHGLARNSRLMDEAEALAAGARRMRVRGSVASRRRPPRDGA